MSTSKMVRRRINPVVGGVIIILVLGTLTLVAVRLGTGRSLGLRGFLSSKVNSVTRLVRVTSDSQRVRSYSRGEFTNIIFLHHSVGNNLIEQGHIREKLSAVGYSFWDHDYNSPGLRDPEGKLTGYSYDVPNDNTDPDGLAGVFAQRTYGLPTNALSGLLQHEVIIFKSCFPNSNIASDEQLEQYKTWYLGMRDVMDRHPDKIFIALGEPPLNPVETSPDAAARARAFANWLKSDEYLKGHPNVFAFDLFGQLAEDNPAAPDYNMLSKVYRDGTDSHPNAKANETIGPVLVNTVDNAIHTYSRVAR